MRTFEEKYVLLVLGSLLFAGIAEAVSYDYSAPTECLAEPLKPQYGGGIIRNPEFNDDLKAWYAYGNGNIQRRTSKEGNNFLVAHSRKQSYDSFSQRIYMQKGKLYTLSAWVRVSEGSAPVTAVIQTNGQFKHAGRLIAESGCWSMLKGGLTVDTSGPAEIYFESKNTTVDIWVDSVSLQPFTEKEWRAHQEQSIEKARKTKVRLQAIDAQGNKMAGAKISLVQTNGGFPIGSSISNAILTNTAYQNWFTSRFTVATFVNEMKWYSTENTQGKEDYSVSDAMLNFAQKHGISVRGHNVFWDDPRYQPWWVKSLSPDQLKIAVWKRINSIGSRYAGKLIHWDVVNENLHWSFFEDKLGKGFSASMYNKALQLDSRATMFLNEYNTIEESADGKSGPAVYLQKLREIQSAVTAKNRIGIGLEAHFNRPNIPYVRATIDRLAATGSPIWITELDVADTAGNQAMYLEQIMRELHSHPAIGGIVLWGGQSPQGDCWRMCLTDKNFRNLPTGDVVDKLIREWTHRPLLATTDNNGLLEALLFHGDYDVTITHPSTNSSLSQSFRVETPAETSEETTHYLQFNE